ncbi:MAG: TonB-dependent receptor [Steroidobacteraceae bacterium]
MKSKALLCLFVGAVAVTGLPAAARSQEASADVPAELREIVVTAEKREASIQKTPLSIGVVTGEEMQKSAQGSLDAALKTVQSVELQGLAQGTQIYIRGVGSSIDPQFADPSIALMVDGAYTGRAEAVESGAYDIQRVEVLRGPQGTLYGRNASGGLVNVVTADPTIDSVHGYFRAQLGNYSMRRAEGALNVPAGESAAVRIAGYREKRDGYVDDGSMDSDSWGVRAKLLMQPAEWLRIVGKVDLYRSKADGINTVPVSGSAGQLNFPPPFFFSNFNPPVAFATNPPVCPGSPFVGCAPNPVFPSGFDSSKGWLPRTAGDPWSNNPEHPAGLVDRRADSYGLDIQANLGPAILTILPNLTRSYNRLVSNYLFGSIVPGVGPTYDLTAYADQRSNTKYTSTEARLTSTGTGPLKYVFGLYYLKSDPGSGQLPTSGTTTSGSPYTITNDLQPGTTLAAFGQVTYSLSPSLRVTGGLRVSRDKIGQAYDIVVGSAASGTTSFSQSQSSTQYKLGLEYDVAEQSLLYAHVSTGFKQGGISPTFPPASFQPEKLVAFEIGSKNRFWDNRLQLNMAAFRYNYKNYQFSTFANLPILDDSGANIGTNAFIVINNAGTTHINGAEAAMDLLPWKLSRVSASVTYLDAKYGEAILPNNPFVNQGEFNLSGRQIQNSPDWSVNLVLEQGFAVGSGILTAAANSHLSTSYYTTPEQYQPGAFQKSFTRTDLSLRYELRGFSVTAMVRNVENEAQTTYVFPAYRRFITAPRTFAVTAGYRF